MTRALDDSSMSPKEIQTLVANGSGIPNDDIQESTAVRSVFENAVSHLNVTGVKPITGHLVYGAGGVELASAVLSLRDSVIPPLANLETPDSNCDLPFVTKKPKSSDSKALLFNSFGFGGQNASLVVKK